MERWLVYLAVVVAVAAALYSVSRLKPQPDYCAEARRLASDVLVAYQSGGRVVGEYNLRGAVVNGSGVFCAECGVALRVPTANSTALDGRARLLLQRSGGKVALLRRE